MSNDSSWGNENDDSNDTTATWDSAGRRIRSRGGSGGGEDVNSSASNNGGGRSDRNIGASWDDFDPWEQSNNNNNDNVDDNEGYGRRRRDDWNIRPNRQSSSSPRPPPSRQQQRGGGPPQNDRRDWGSQSRSSSRPQRRDRDRRDPSNDDVYNNENQNSDRSSSFRPNRNGGRSSFGNQRGGGGRKDAFNQKEKTARSINLNALEGSGFVHLYGLSSVLNALSANRRDLETSKENADGGMVDDDRFANLDPSTTSLEGPDDEFDNVRGTQPHHEVKPQAQFRPYLFVQDRSFSERSGRRGAKASAASQALELAQERNVPVDYVDKGILNTLSGNRPHQGFVLRCGKLTFESLSRIPVPSKDNDNEFGTPSIWLVLDEVVDPQNLGALLRSAYFLGGGGGGKNIGSKALGVLVCSKNSAPPSPVVSAASAGALEVLDVYSTNNLPRTLSQAREDGFRVIGASSSVPLESSSRKSNDDSAYDEDDEDDDSEGPHLYDLQDLPVHVPDENGNDRPILLVLGSEGHGLRSLVAKACTEFVRIPSGVGALSTALEDDDDDNEDDTISEAGVDSLNVSVTGGIMLWHLLSGRL